MDTGEAGDRGSVLTGHDNSGIPGDSGDGAMMSLVSGKWSLVKRAVWSLLIMGISGSLDTRVT